MGAAGSYAPKETISMILNQRDSSYKRSRKSSANVLQGIVNSFFYHDNMTIVYKAFTTLCLICGITKEENELAIQELLNVFMESLVLYFGQVSELDIVFNMERTYMILDEIILNGSVGFTSKERALLPLQLLDAGS